MKLIFVDEAGTSELEPVTIVTAIIADADLHVLEADRLIKEILDTVPGEIKNGFLFHAKDVFNSRKYQAHWSTTDRLRLLTSMMSVPRKIGMAVCLGATWRGFGMPLPKDSPITSSQMDHAMTFGSCLAVADRGIREHAKPNEIALVIAEDVPEMRRHLKTAVSSFRDKPEYIPVQHLRKTPSDEKLGFINQSGEMSIKRIRNSVTFVGKSEDPIVQVADACAFGFRRFLANDDMGETFAKAILGDITRLRDFSPPCGFASWWP